MLLVFAMLAAEEPPPPPMWTSWVPIIGLVFLAYFFLLGPQMRQEKKRQALVSALKKNDRIVNSGGIIGIVESVKEKEDEVVLKGGVRITKSSVVRIVSPEEGAKES